MTLNLNPEPASSKKSKKYKKVMAVGGAVSLAGLGSTFAANISLNQGNNVEFGQGVAQTAACDEDGFSITPVTSYDNAHSMFRVDRIQISGLNLTPVGTGYSAGGYGSQDDAKTAHPGQYYDGSTWKRTCDGVVLDFKAYTDDPAYASYTRDSYFNDSNTSLETPIMWSQYDGRSGYGNMYNAGYAVKFDLSDNNDSISADTMGWADTLGYRDGAGNVRSGSMWDIYSWVNSNGSSPLIHSDPVDSMFDITFNSNSRPNAASISKITVASMADFPSDYRTYNFDNYS